MSFGKAGVGKNSKKKFEKSNFYKVYTIMALEKNCLYLILVRKQNLL